MIIITFRLYLVFTHNDVSQFKSKHNNFFGVCEKDMEKIVHIYALTRYKNKTDVLLYKPATDKTAV